MSYIGHPLLGDSLYNTNENLNLHINRQALHSYKMEFVHPVSKCKVVLETDVPDDIKTLII